jgi:hypothetical protein
MAHYTTFPQTKAEMGHLRAGANEQKGACGMLSVMGMSPHETLAPLGEDAFINDFFFCLEWEQFHATGKEME